MDYNSSAPQGRLFPGEMVIHSENAVIEEVTAKTEKTGYVLISYGVSDENNTSYMQEVRLNVGNNTIIMEENGVSLNLQDLTQGMRVDADFSAVMTRSIPPQSDAYRIVVLQEETPMYYTTTDRVVNVDTNNGLLLTGNPYDFYDQMVFNISDETEILDQNNNAIPLEAIQPGQMVQVEHAIFQTLSIPPQSPAYRVQIL